MIRVNFIRMRCPIRGLKARRQAIFFALLFIVSVGYTGYWWNGDATTISTLRAQISDLKTKLGQLEKKVAEVEKFQKQKAELRAKLAVIRRLDANRSGPAKVLSRISRSLPDRLWLTQLSDAGGGALADVILDGFAFSNVDIATFMKNLQATDVFTAVDLNESKAQELEGIKVMSFKLQARRRRAVKAPARQQKGAPKKRPKRS